MRDSVIFAAPCFILGRMKTTQQPEPPGKFTASLASIVGLALVWSVVWANLPSREELLSEQPNLGTPAPPPVPELDLTIPGVPPVRPAGELGRTGGPALSKQLSEVKCDAEVQEVCPASLTEEERRQCAIRSVKQLSVPCRRIVQERLTYRK